MASRIVWNDGDVVSASDLNTWFEDIEELQNDAAQSKNDAETAANTAVEAAVHSPTIQNGTWWVWDFDNEEYVDTEVNATGPQGVSPTLSETKAGKVTTVTVTDAAGTHTFQLHDGADGTGTGDMVKATYDTNNNGVVDNSEKLNGHADTYFAKASDLTNASASARGLVKYAQGAFTISANGFTADSTYEDYPFRKAIAVSGCTANHFADVCFDLASATGGKIAPAVETYSGGFYVYTKEQNAEQITGTYKVTYNA